jgi:serine/threonine protein kinase
MGRVLLCHDPVLDRAVAVKHLRADLVIPPEHVAPLIERMRQEARASARVSHPNLVALHDMGEDPHLGLFLVFEYVDGPTLKDGLERGPLDKQAAAKLALELGSALSYAHAAGVVHRDVKPENVMLSRTGAKVADFGIARIPDSTLTQGGSILGTPAYSAPEAIRSARFSPQSDQFSLAATLYEAISGQRAFPGDDAVAVATKIANEEAPPIALLRGLDLSVDRVLARGLAKQPKARFANCEEFGRALADALTREQRPLALTLPDVERSQRTTGRKFVGLSLTVAAVVGAWFFWDRISPVARSPLRFAQGSPPAEEVILPVAWLIERSGQAGRLPGDTPRAERNPRVGAGSDAGTRAPSQLAP